MSDLIGERQQVTDLLPDLSPEDQAFQNNIDQIIRALPTYLSMLLIAAIAFEGYSFSRSKLNEEVRAVFVGTSQDSSNIHYQTILPSALPELSLPELKTYDFHEGQEVMTNKNGVSRPGKINEVVTVSNRVATRVSYVIVDFEDGSRDGFNPEEIAVLP